LPCAGDLRSPGVILETGERRFVELGIADDSTRRIDERHADA
jgi:hypothetical protein